jgi:hypothetical protein
MFEVVSPFAAGDGEDFIETKCQEYFHPKKLITPRFVLFTKYYYHDQDTDNCMGGVCSKHEERRNTRGTDKSSAL